MISCCIFFLVTFGISVATVVMFSKLPKSVCCGQRNSQVQPIIINLDGQTYRMQNLQNQGHTVQGSYVMQPVAASAPIAAVQTVVPMTTVQAHASGQVTTVQPATPVAIVQPPVPVAALQPTVPLTTIQTADPVAAVPTEQL